MDRSTERIGKEIDHELELMRSNLAELEDRVRSAVDWRRQFADHPAAGLAAAFGAGLLIARLARRPVGSPRIVEYGAKPTTADGDPRRREISLAWRTIESALIGVAAAKLRDTIAAFVPGFREQITRREGNGYRHEA